MLFGVYISAIGSAPTDGEGEAANQKIDRRPAPALTVDEKKSLLEAVEKLDRTDEVFLSEAPRDARLDYFASIRDGIAAVVGSNFARPPVGETPRARFASAGKQSRGQDEKSALLRSDEQAEAVLARAAVVRKLNHRLYTDAENNFIDGKNDATTPRTEAANLRDETMLLAGSGELPARNVANIGYLLYADHLLAVELAGTLLLVATIGAVAIAQRKGVAA